MGSLDAMGSIRASKRQSQSTAWPSIYDLSTKSLAAPSAGSRESRDPSDTRTSVGTVIRETLLHPNKSLEAMKKMSFVFDVVPYQM